VANWVQHVVREPKQMDVGDAPPSRTRTRVTGPAALYYAPAARGVDVREPPARHAETRWPERRTGNTSALDPTDKITAVTPGGRRQEPRPSHCSSKACANRTHAAGGGGGGRGGGGGGGAGWGGGGGGGGIGEPTRPRHLAGAAARCAPTSRDLGGRRPWRRPGRRPRGSGGAQGRRAAASRSRPRGDVTTDAEPSTSTSTATTSPRYCQRGHAAEWRRRSVQRRG
jgi:hypothetical protein